MGVCSQKTGFNNPSRTLGHGASSCESDSKKQAKGLHMYSDVKTPELHWQRVANVMKLFYILITMSKN